MSRVVVSISCITYNHAPFIRECLDGFLMQETNFQFEILIHDDASTDGTKEIIEEYVAKYPDLIFPIYQVENQYSKGVRGMMPKYNFPRARGKYIALCEGDDYWTDPCKLQKQVDFLESHPNFSIVYTDCNVYSEEKNKFIEIPKSYPRSDFLTVYELAQSHFIFTPTAMFRNDIHFPYKLFRHPGGDSTIFLLLTAGGSLVKFLNIKSAVYRIHQGGIFSLRDQKPFDERVKLEMKMYDMIYDWQIYFGKNNKKLREIFSSKKLEPLNKIRSIALEHGNTKIVRSISFKMLSNFGFRTTKFSLFISTFFSFLFPKIHSRRVRKKTI
jgi:glycosyltransferase involved in cell wall biosynthesis